MIAIALLAVLAQAEPLPAEPEAPNPLIQEAPPEEPLPAPAEPADPERWKGEEKRVHVGIGLRAHVGLMETQGAPILLAASGMFVGVNVRTFRHQEACVSFELTGGFPDTIAGETLITYRFHLTPRFAIGAGVIFLWGFWSFRGGVEVPFTVRLGESRRHELGLAVRGTAGAYNNSTYVWWDFERQRPAFTLDGAITYTFLF